MYGTSSIGRLVLEPLGPAVFFILRYCWSLCSRLESTWPGNLHHISTNNCQSEFLKRSKSV